jgi:hypothetical protein
MTDAALDRLLAALITAMAVTGLLTLRAGSAGEAWLFTTHAVLAGALLASLAVKVARSGRRAVAARRWRRLAVGIALSVLASASLIAGYAWVAGGAIARVEVPSIGSVTVLTIHVWAAIALLPVLVVHLLPRRWRLLRPGRGLDRYRPGRWLTRRSVLATGSLAFASVALFAGADALDRLRGGSRRFTGSRLLPPDGVPPSTTFFGEPTPDIDLDRWRLRVTGAVGRPLALSLDDLRAIGAVDIRATLDCTSGWALEATWHGAAMGPVLEHAAPDGHATAVEVRSVTGWASSFPIDQAAGLVLATEVAGRTLAAGNGAPCRLVAPDRRGLDWVKWVEEIRVS